MRRWLIGVVAALALAGCGSQGAPPPHATALAPAAGPLAGLAFLDASHGWALVDCTAATSLVPGQPGCTLLATADGGTTWRAVAKGLPAAARLQMLTARDGFATIEGGTCAHGLCPGYVLASGDGGRTWTTRYAGPVEIASIDFSGVSTGWSIVDGGVDTSTDGGAHWHQSVPFARGVMTACTMDFVRFSTSLSGLAGGHGKDGPCIATTADGGTTWRLARVPGGRGCTAAGGSVSWLEIACGAALTVWRPANGGAAWKRAWSGGAPPLFVLDAAPAWRGAPRTTDGGATWRKGQGLGAATLAFVSADRGWARAAGGRAVYTTTNGGAAWSRQWP